MRNLSMRRKLTNTARRPNAKEADDDIDIIFGSIKTHIKAFAQFADTQFDASWYQRQPPMARATLCFMADEVVELARTTMADAEDELEVNEAFQDFGTLAECAFGAAYKSTRDGVLSNLLTQIHVEEGVDWIRRCAVLPSETDCFEGLLPDINRVVCTLSGQTLMIALCDITHNSNMLCALTREMLINNLSIVAQLGERAEWFEAQFADNDFVRGLRAKQDTSTRLMKESAGDMAWYAAQIAQLMRQRQY